MAHRYPRIGAEIRIGRGMCQVCRSGKAEFRLDIETDCMRGDDEVVRSCKECKRLGAVEILRRYQEGRKNAQTA